MIRYHNSAARSAYLATVGGLVVTFGAARPAGGH
jgi:hypothetical protein